MIDVDVHRLWFVTLDTVRLRGALVGSMLARAESAAHAAGRASKIPVLSVCAIPNGIRLVARAANRQEIRRFSRRMVALMVLKLVGAQVRWRQPARVSEIAPKRADRYLAYIAACRSSMPGEPTVATKHKRSVKSAIRRTLRLLPLIERSNAALLGADDAAGRVRRYVSAHEAPSDDRAAFSRLCDVIFAQGVGFEAVEQERSKLDVALCARAPEKLARLRPERLAARMSEPVMRDRNKIESCIATARRWVELAAEHGSYLGQIAKCAADDEGPAGWPALVSRFLLDMPAMSESMTRAVLKRWGFFTAAGHAGSRRLLIRLEVLEASADWPTTQRFVGAVAQSASADPYAIEAALALFAGLGPCRAQPLCASCALSEKCPTGSPTAVT